MDTPVRPGKAPSFSLFHRRDR